MKITHHFLNRLLDKKQRGYIAFTSSSAGFVPNPLSAMYASTKAFMTMFATSLAAEVKSLGVDVCVVHPSPMATNFFDAASKLNFVRRRPRVCLFALAAAPLRAACQPQQLTATPHVSAAARPTACNHRDHAQPALAR